MKSTTTTKFEIDKFNGRNDFNLWRLKMRALLVQHAEGAKSYEARNRRSSHASRFGIGSKAEAAQKRTEALGNELPVKTSFGSASEAHDSDLEARFRLTTSKPNKKR